MHFFFGVARRRSGRQLNAYLLQADCKQCGPESSLKFYTRKKNHQMLHLPTSKALCDSHTSTALVCEFHNLRVAFFQSSGYSLLPPFTMRIARPLLSVTRVCRPRHGQSNSGFAASLPLLCNPCRRCLSDGRRLQNSEEQKQPPSPPPSANGLPTDAPNSAVIFSGIQPTGVPHLGNYLGALLRWVQLQEGTAADKSTQLYYSVVDLHALTSVQTASSNSGAVLRQRRRETLAALLAIGLDPERCVLFYQSAVPAHSELMWLLSCTASVGYLSRMTQWKVCRSI